jgi:hypothetical protein
LSAELAGPAIRAVELGRVLATEHDVDVASTASCSGPGPDANWQFVDDAALRALSSIFTTRSTSSNSSRRAISAKPSADAWCSAASTY